jgi:CBS domain-containing protein
MKSLEAIPLFSRTRTWVEEEDEPTSEIFVLGSLVHQPATTLDQQASIGTACDLFVDLRIPAIAVIDGDELCGILTRTDVLRAMRDQPDARVGEAMSSFVLVMPVESTIESAAALMAVEQVGEVIVTRNGDLVGLVSVADIARHVARRAGVLPSG